MKEAGHITTDIEPETQKIIQMKSLSELISNAKEAVKPAFYDEDGNLDKHIANYFIDYYKDFPEKDGVGIKEIITMPEFFDALFDEMPIDAQIQLLNFLIKDYVERGIPIDEVFSKKSNKEENSLTTLNVPVLGYIAAGLPIFAEEHIEEWTEIPNMWNLKDGETFVLKVKGDSMIGSRIYEGDKVIVKMQADVENGEIAVVNVNGDEATLKRVKKTESGQVILYPDNPRYDPIFITNENARIIGKVVQVMFEPKRN
jgi:SOS regulatory protein LexA